MQNKNNNKNGYTLIETMIAVSLFIIIVMAGMGALLNANLLHGKSQNMRSIMDNLSFVMDDMSRNLRTGTNYYCITGSSIPTGVDNTQSCANGGGISFRASDGSQWVYYVSANPNIPGSFSISRIINGITVQLTPDEVAINSTASGFSVLGAEPPNKNPPPLGDQQQPFVAIRLVGTMTYKNVVTPFSLQTSVSQRLIDI
jgi:type II secretory pathway pseudopilin PulG